MNEKLIKDLVNLKLNMADEILNHLPERVSNEVRDLGRVILVSINDNIKDTKEQPKKSKPSSKLTDIPIE